MNEIKKQDQSIVINNLVTITDGEPLTTSRIIADVFNKRHSHVLESIENLVSQLTDRNFGSLKWFTKVDYVDNHNQLRNEYQINRDGFTLLAMGFTGAKALEWKLKYIQAFNDMEAKLRDGDSLPDNRSDIAKLILKASRPQIQAIKELYPEYFLVSAPTCYLESVADKNTSYIKWIEDFNITAEWIGEFPTIDIYNNYARYSIENHFIPLGKKQFYSMLELDFGLTRRQRSDGYRYFLTA